MNFLLPLLVGGPDINLCDSVVSNTFFKRELFSSSYLLSRRYFSSKGSPAVVLGKVRYDNADTQKEKIYKDNRGKVEYIVGQTF